MLVLPAPIRQLFGSTKDQDDIEKHVQGNSSGSNIQNLPILSGIMIPFSIMLSIPSLTGHWYVRTGEGSVLLEVRPNPLLLDVAMGFSMGCGVLANICLVIRFSERKIWLMTMLCIMFLSLHDLINIPAVTIFGVIHRFDDGFTYGQPFWLTVCSTIFSTATNITLIYDCVQTTDFTHSGSGLTHKQRSLVIIIIIMLCYVSLGSLLLSVTLKIDFIDALYLSVVSIETIGFGDLHPTSTGTRVMACGYIAGGILNLALAPAVAHTLITGRERERNIRTRWRAAVRWRLRAMGLPTWVDDRDEERQQRVGVLRRRRHWYSWLRRVWRRLRDEVWREWEDPAWKYVYGPKHKRLNLEPLSEAQLETAALETGAPLSELIPKGLKLRDDESDDPPNSPNPSSGSAMDAGLRPPSLTHVRMGGMVTLLGNFAVAVTRGPFGGPQNSLTPNDSEETATEEGFRPSGHGIPLTSSLTMTMQDDEGDGNNIAESLEVVKRNAFYARLSVALTLFVVFWMAGSAIFMKTEGWAFGSAAYFCKFFIIGFVSFTTVGYGTMTILISILAEAYSSSYKNFVIKSEDIQAATDDSLSPLSAGLGSGSYTRSPSLTNSNTPRFGRNRRQSLMAPIPEQCQLTADGDESAQESAVSESLEALPQHVLRHADHLLSLMRTNSADREEEKNQDSEVSDPRTMEALLLEIEQSLREISNAAKDALVTKDQ
ncbi:hypothetical protein BDZ97DRAFT_1791260 [Flammula alnicola]|nr:hypothetical protein BDZ97DRAFT_1791260 [Flammula alnicola]